MISAIKNLLNKIRKPKEQQRTENIGYFTADLVLPGENVDHIEDYIKE